MKPRASTIQSALRALIDQPISRPSGPPLRAASGHRLRAPQPISVGLAGQPITIAVQSSAIAWVMAGDAHAAGGEGLSTVPVVSIGSRREDAQRLRSWRGAIHPRRVHDVADFRAELIAANEDEAAEDHRCDKHRCGGVPGFAAVCHAPRSQPRVSGSSADLVNARADRLNVRSGSGTVLARRPERTLVRILNVVSEADSE
jgi:hypothetical protein